MHGSHGTCGMKVGVKAKQHFSRTMNTEHWTVMAIILNHWLQLWDTTDEENELPMILLDFYQIYALSS